MASPAPSTHSSGASCVRLGLGSRGAGLASRRLQLRSKCLEKDSFISPGVKRFRTILIGHPFYLMFVDDQLVGRFALTTKAEVLGPLPM